MERDSFLFYRSFFDGLKELPDDIRVKAYDMIMNYALNGIEPEEGGVAKAIFAMARPQIDANNKRYAAAVKGGVAKASQSDAKAVPNTCQSDAKAVPNDNVNVNVNENVIKREINKEKSSRFSPPTAEEVREYCRVQELTVDADRFIDFYASKNWYVGKNKMKDWKAACRNWSRSQRESTKPKPNSFHNYTQRPDDLDDLAAQLDRKFAEGMR